ncbi:MAG: DUF92 domain-containing protein [Ferruginibacter sp.]
MALNKEVFKTRTITAIVFAAVMLAGLFIPGGILFFALFLVILCGCLFEFYKIARIIKPKNFLTYLPLGLFYIIIPVLLLIRMGFSNIIVADGKHFLSSSFIYSPLIPCAIIFSIWINDTMAYIVGSLIGKTPFSKISPKKTWEGTMGGALLCGMVIALLGYFIPAATVLPVKHWIIIAALCALFGTLGDLFESKLKRMAGIKDSGSFMPGHGGFLDRFDSLLWAAPAVWLYLRFMMPLF